jgi:predicted transcriptional regulator
MSNPIQSPAVIKGRIKRMEVMFRIQANAYRCAQEDIGSAARAARARVGLSLREVARRMGVSAPFLCDLEYGRRNWSSKHAEAWAAALTPAAIDCGRIAK